MSPAAAESFLVPSHTFVTNSPFSVRAKTKYFSPLSNSTSQSENHPSRVKTIAPEDPLYAFKTLNVTFSIGGADSRIFVSVLTTSPINMLVDLTNSGESEEHSQAKSGHPDIVIENRKIKHKTFFIKSSSWLNEDDTSRSQGHRRRQARALPSDSKGASP